MVYRNYCKNLKRFVEFHTNYMENILYNISYKKEYNQNVISISYGNIYFNPPNNILKVSKQNISYL